MNSFQIGKLFEILIDWMNSNLKFVFKPISIIVISLLDTITSILLFAPWFITGFVIVIFAYLTAKKGVAIFSFLGLLLIQYMNLWEATMETLSLVLSSSFVALIIGIPIGIWSSKNDYVEKIVRPLLDFMQTMPAFVYLIPAVFFFKLGQVPGVIATLVFAMPPAVRFTNLGIRQVPKEVKEAAISFGSTPKQMLMKVELPTALPTILAGINQTIMLALSMVVISAMIGAGGLGEQVLKGLTQLKVGVGFESGFAIVILAIILDRITQSLGNFSKSKKERI